MSQILARILFPGVVMALLAGCGAGDAESVKVVDEMNSTLNSILTDLNAVQDEASARKALRTISSHQNKEERLVREFKKLTENQDLSPRALSKLNRASTTFSQLEGRLKELARDPKIKKQLQPLIKKYLNGKSPFE